MLDGDDADPLDPNVGAVLLNLAKTDAIDSVQSGSQLTYTIVYANDGASKLTASNLVLTEVYDPNIAFASASPMPNEADNVWYPPDLAPGAAVTINVQAASPRPNGTQLSNYAELSSDGGLSASAEEITTIQSSPGLTLAKSDRPDPVRPGEVLTYALTYGNDSGANAVATNTVLRETYDPNVTYLSADPEPDTGDNEWRLGDLHPGDVGTVSIRVQVNGPLTDGTQLTNIAVIEADQGSASAKASTLVNSATWCTSTRRTIPIRFNWVAS